MIIIIINKISVSQSLVCLRQKEIERERVCVKRTHSLYLFSDEERRGMGSRWSEGLPCDEVSVSNSQSLDPSSSVHQPNLPASY